MRALFVKKITEDNFIEATRLKVNPEQEAFVASNAASSIEQSKFRTFLECYGLYNVNTMVRFSAFGKHPKNGTSWIVRHMIGEQHQRQGYGYAGLRAIIDHMRQLHACSSVFLDVSPDNVAAISLYEKTGFPTQESCRKDARFSAWIWSNRIAGAPSVPTIDSLADAQTLLSQYRGITHKLYSHQPYKQHALKLEAGLHDSPRLLSDGRKS